MHMHHLVLQIRGRLKTWSGKEIIHILFLLLYNDELYNLYVCFLNIRAKHVCLLNSVDRVLGSAVVLCLTPDDFTS